MEIRGEHSLPLFVKAQLQADPSALPPPRIADKKPQVSTALTLRREGPPPETNGAQLVSETLEELENGTRRTQVFEKPDGRQFTRIEERTTTPRGSRRNVAQQNPSGNTTLLEELLERTADGKFQRILHFTDETGETSTKIKTGIQPEDLFTLSGGALPSHSPGPFESLRGRHLDLEA